MELPYKERIVAFIDILAFSTLIARLEHDSVLHTKLQSALRAIKNYKEIAGKEQFAQKNIEVSVFSDSIVISALPEHFFDVVWSCLGLQSRLLALGVLTRGGISVGPTVHADDILYGAGMIKAYQLEKGAAIFPRVVIDPCLMPKFSAGHRAMFLTEDHDGLSFIDSFSMGILPPDSEALLEDGWNPHHVGLVELGKLIEKERDGLKDANHLMKWNWLERQRVQAVDYLKRHGAPRLFHLMRQEK